MTRQNCFSIEYRDFVVLLQLDLIDLITQVFVIFEIFFL